MRSAPGDAVPSFGDRVKNLFRTSYRGLVGFLVPFFALIWQGEKFNHPKTVQCMWLFMVWVFLWQPVHLPMGGLIPVFVLPICGVMSSNDTCYCYMDESIVMFLLSTMVNMLLNNSGFDRRIELKLLRSGDNSAYNPRKLVFKSATAAFVMSIFSNRQMVTNDLITFLAPTLIELKGSPDADFDSVRAIICTAIHAASAIGSNVFPHGSMTILYMRGVFFGSAKSGYDYPDVFNYMQYVIFAFPVALIMFVLTTIYFMILVGGKSLSPASLAKIGGALNKHREAVPKHMTLHEKWYGGHWELPEKYGKVIFVNGYSTMISCAKINLETVIFMFLFLVTSVTRWCKFLNMGWASFSKKSEFPTLPGVKDSVCAAVFVVLLFSIPKGFGWVKYLTAQKYKDLPPQKTESGVLFWRFVDKNVLYGYLFMFGAGRAITDAGAVEAKGFGSLGGHLTQNLGKIVTDQSWPIGVFIVCFMAVFLANIMPGIAACCIWCPFVVNMARDGAPQNWETKVYLGLLAVGFGTSLGFMCPFLHTPAYFTHYVGKTPKVKMAKTAVGAVIICFLVLWLGIAFLAPMLWDPNDDGGFVTIKGPDFTTPAPTTAAPGV